MNFRIKIEFLISSKLKYKYTAETCNKFGKRWYVMRRL